MITEHSHVFGYKRKLSYLGNSQSTTNWYLDEYSTTTDIDAIILGLYKLYDIRRGKKPIQGNTTSTTNICGSQEARTGTSNMLIPLQERQVRPRITPLTGTAPLSITSSSSTTMVQFTPSQTTHHSTLPFVVPPKIFQGSNLPSFSAAPFRQQYLVPFPVHAQNCSPESYFPPHPSSQTNLQSIQNTNWETQGWTSIYSATFPANLQQYQGSSSSLPPAATEYELKNTKFQSCDSRLEYSLSYNLSSYLNYILTKQWGLEKKKMEEVGGNWVIVCVCVFNCVYI